MEEFVFISDSHKDRFYHTYDSALHIIENEYRSPMKLLKKLKNHFIDEIIINDGKLILVGNYK